MDAFGDATGDGPILSRSRIRSPIASVWIFRSSLPVEIVRGGLLRHARILALISGVWAASFVGIFEPISNLLYDVYYGLLDHKKAVEPRVLMVLLSRSEEPGLEDELPLEDDLLKLVRGLFAGGAERVVFGISLDVSPEFYSRTLRAGDVVFSRDLRRRRSKEEAFELEPLPQGSDPQHDWVGVSAVSPSVRGIHRRQDAWIEVQGKRELFFEVAAAPQFRERSPEDLPFHYYIRFRGGPRSLPAVSSSLVLEDGVLGEIVRGKTVLIGTETEHGSHMIETPATRSGEGFSRLEFHAHALNTLLAGRAIYALGPLSTLLLLIAVGCGSWLLFQWIEVRTIAWLSSVLIVSYCGLAWLFLEADDLWIPVLELVAIQCGTLAYSLKVKATLATEAMSRLVLSSTDALRERYAPEAFLESQGPWSMLVNMVNQTLDLDRLIFLEAVRNKRVVREITALNCSLTDISEKRRDFGGGPYLTAIEARAAIRVEQFLCQAIHDEEQYLVPLLHGEEVLGFWAFGIAPQKAANIKSFNQLVNDYALLISELLWQRRKRDADESGGDELVKALRQGRVESLYQDLTGTFRTLGTRLAQTEALLSGFNTSIVVFDLFGRILKVNANMKQLLESEALEVKSLTALDLLSSLSEYDLSRSRRILRHVIIEQQTMTLPVRLASQAKGRFLLHLKPIDLNDVELEIDSDVYVGAKCILCELADASAFVGLFEMKEKLTRRLGLQLRNDLASIEMSSSLLGSSHLSEGQRQNISEIIHDKVGKMMDVLVECQQYLTLESNVQQVERFPVDSCEALEAALEQLGSILRERNVRSSIDRPNVMSYVLAANESIDTVFSTILKVLLSDAIDDSEIAVQVTESSEMVTFEFKNQGFGLPDERFQEYVFGEKMLATEELKALRETLRWIEAWGGSLEAHSQVGEGIHLTLSLVKFL